MTSRRIELLDGSTLRVWSSSSSFPGRRQALPSCDNFKSTPRGVCVKSPRSRGRK